MKRLKKWKLFGKPQCYKTIFSLKLSSLYLLNDETWIKRAIPTNCHAQTNRRLGVIGRRTRVGRGTQLVALDTVCGRVQVGSDGESETATDRSRLADVDDGLFLAELWCIVVEVYDLEQCKEKLNYSIYVLFIIELK